MRIVLQRVVSACVNVDGNEIGSIEKGYVVYIGVAKDDTKAIVDKLVDRIAKLRIFADENGKTNLSAQDIGGQILIISQFTLNADLSSNRPSFSSGADAQLAKELYEYFINSSKVRFCKVSTGQFGAHMHVYSEGDGPFTLVLESGRL
ncbi:MAG: D-aminoacyl-tRNA deacylase [Firmicutes bacterium]|nr:D-aminoacyl-tRNA deacylase [Bacillota bacterium]